jgi:hypothetical protein
LVAILSIGIPLYFLAAFLYVNGSISNLLEALYYTIDKCTLVVVSTDKN